MERINATTGSYNFIDLFAGAGGLSEGFIQAGFSPVAHVEMNPYAAQTLETRTGYYYLKAQGKLDIYKDYISGKITRDEFLQHIPEEQLQSVFCETMSNETLPRLFENIDNIPYHCGYDVCAAKQNTFVLCESCIGNFRIPSL